MASYEELKQRVRNGQTASTQTQTKATYEELKKKAKQERFEEDVKKVDDSYINLFVNTANSFLKSASEESGKVGWGNASATYDDRYNAYKDLDYRQRVISTWLDANKASIPEDSYKDMLGLIGSYNNSTNSVVRWFKDTKDFYSQWDTEEDYNFWKDHSTQEGRQNWYADLQSKLDKLKADRAAENSSWSEVDPIELGVESMEYQTAAQKHTSRLKEIDDEIAAIETEMRNYERGNYTKDGQYYGSKVVDDYNKYSQKPDFSAVSANRDFDNPTRDELTQYDAMNDSSTWYYDENNVLRDAYGNEVEKDASGKWVNPNAQEHAVTDRLGIFLSATEKDMQEYMGTIVSGTWGNIIGDGIDGSWDQLTDNEIAIYYYLLNESGQETADKYLSDMKRELNRRSTTAYNQQLADSFDDASLLEKIALNAASVPAQLFSGIASTAENAAYALRGQDINPYSAAHSGMHFSNTVRSETAEDFDATGIKIPVLDFTLGDAYQAGMSILDSYAAIGIGGNFGGVLLATNAASSEATRLYEQGASKHQIALGSAAAGAAEMVFESLSIEKLITMKDATTVGQMVKNALIQAGVEASEEGFTEIANIITNSIIMGNQSDWAQLVEEYNGDTWQAFLSKVKDVANASLAGFISGAGSAGAPSAVNAAATYAQQQAQYRNAGKAINYAEGGVDALLSLANEVAGVSEGSVQKKLTKGIASVENNASNKKVGKLYDTVQTANNLANAPQNQADIVKSLTRKGFRTETATDIAEALIARYNGKQLNKAQTKLLESVDGSEVVKSVVSNIMFNAKSTMGQRSQNIRDFDSGISTGIIKRSLGMDTKAANKAVQKEFTPEGTYETSVEGKSIRTDTGEVVDIKGVASIRKGEMLLDIGDGNTVNAKEVSYATKEQALIYEAVANMGERIDATTANKLIARYNGGNATVFARGMAQAYTYGFYGLDTSEMLGKNSFAADLTQEQRNYAYNLGSQYRNVKDQADKANVRAASVAKAAGAKGVFYRSKDGIVTDFRSYEKDSGIALKDIQKTAIEAMEKMSQIMGVRFNVFESWVENGKRYYLDENGVKTEGNPNGFYDTRTGEIYIDLAAGNDYQGTMLFTVAHELTHFMRQWSPEHFTKIARIVFKHGGMKGNVSELVAAKQAKAKARGKVLSYDTAMEEAVADGMETILKDGNVVEFMAEVKQKDHTAWEKLKEWFKNLAEFLRDMVKAYSGHSAQTTEGARVAAFSKELLRQIEQIYAEGAVAAGENYQAAMENVVEKNAEAVPADEIITDGAVVTDGEGTKFSIKSMKHDIAEGQMFEDLKTYCGWTQKQVNELRQNLQDLVEYMTPFRDILDMNETYGREGRRFSPYKPNSDPLYKISMDFSTLCSKRLLTQYVIENLQLRENRPMSAEEQMAIRDMLNEYRKVEKGLQVACAMCYVEAARLKSPQQIGKWLADPATQMRNYFADKDPEFSAYIKEKQADFKESRGYARNATKKDMSAKDVRDLNNIRPKIRSQYQLTAEEAKIVERAKALPNSTYLTAANLANLSETEPTIYAAYTAFVRTATRSKSLETDEPYYYGDSRRDNGNGIIVSDSFIEAVNRENGMRFSSWSDWRIQHLLDYITAVIDNSVRGAAMHGYTKFGEEVRVLGKTGMMFNMSGVAGTQTGLNEDGSISFSPTESVDVNEAIQLRDEFPETAGLQCIGVSDAHIIALLRSDIIDYIIPYHVSGLNAALRRMADIYGWDDYTSSQHAAVDKSIKFENAVDQEHWHEEPVWSEFFVGYNTGMTGIEAMRESANRYVQLCKDRGLKPKFEQFLKEENYWKLLIDRKMINQKTGKLIQQKAVTPAFDFDTIMEVVDRYVQNYDSGMEARALNHIVENWDSIPKRIRDLKKQGGTKAKKVSKAVDTLANQTLAAQPENGTKASIREEFYKEFDAWDKQDTHVSFVTGTTSDALKSIGMKDQNIILRSGTVLQKIKDHPEMTFDIFKGIPELLEHPVIVQFSDAIDPKTKRPKYDSSITVLGELYAEVQEDGKTVKKPVLVSLELLPTKNKGTTVLDFAIIKSAYSKNALQQYLNENSILYIDPDKKRTDSWLSLTRLQLPFGENRYGPIRKIAYVDGKVKVQSPKSMTEMQKKLFDAGIIDEFGNKLFSDRDSDGNQLSKEQQAYFADSQVRDAYGNLMVMYHGTANGGAFTIFDGDKLGNEARTTQIGQGFYFTNMKKEAESYTKNVDIYGRVSKGKNPHLHQVYLNITNPFDINADQMDMEKVKAVYMDGTNDYFFSNWIPFYLDKKTVNGKVVTKADVQAMSKDEKVSAYVDYLSNFGTKEVLSNMVRAFPYGKQSELLASMQNQLGYDGIVEEFRPGQYQYVAFSSEQVKAVDNKNPTADPDIRYSDRDTDDKQLTEDQQEFFEKSKVRDEQGRLKVLYHGSRYEAFTEFDISQGVWLTPVQSYAEVYAEMWHTWRDDMDGAKRDDINGLEPSVYADPDYRLYKMYANIKNPADIGELNQELTSTVVRKLARVLGVNYSRVKDMASDYEGQWTYEMTRSEEFIELAHQQGFDGFKATENGKETWCAFDSPNQVKLTTNEVPSGFYDIRYSDREGAIELSDVNTKFSLRDEAPPKKTKIGYKAFFVKDGKLYPPMVANPSGAGTPVGVWLNADTGSPMRDSEGNIVQNKSGRAKVAAGGKGTKGGGGSLAWRPGWHLGPIPDATQFSVDPASKEWSEWLKKTGKTSGETKNIGNKGNPIYLNPHIVFAEVEFAADVDYQLEAYEYGVNKKGNFDHSQAGIPYVIKDGYYRYRTNSMAPGALSWYITGAMKVNRILTDAECREICEASGRDMMPRLGGDFDFESHNLTAGEVTPTEDLSGVAPKQDFSDEVLKLPGYVRRRLNFSDPNFRKAFEDDSIADMLDYYESLYNGIRYQDRAEESVSNRSLLANAFEGVAQNEIERNKIQEYKDKIGLVNAEEKKLRQLNEQIKELSFAKGPKDTKKIRELQFEATQTANRISTYDKILLRLEASKPLQDVLSREKEMVRKREKQKGKEALEAYREKTAKTQRELLEKWQESRKKGIDSRNRTVMRHKIKDVVNDLNQYLLNGTKDRHVPIGLQKAVAEALNAVNMDTVGAEERIAKLNEELRKAKSPEAIREIVKRIDHVREMGDRMDERLKKLKAAYDEFINSDDPLIANSHDEGMSAHMMKLIVRVGDTPLRDMTVDQLQDVYDVYKIVLATIRNANKSFKDNKNREISTRANQVMAEIDSLGIKRGKRIAGLDWVEKFGWDNLKPVYAMEHIGSRGLIDAYNNVRAGEDTWARDIVEAREYYLDMFKKYSYDSWDFQKKSRFTSTTGMNFELTLDQIMSLYAYSKRDQAADHLKYGGIVFDPKTEVVEQTKHGIKVKYNVANATSYNISEETLAAIISELNDDQRGFVDEMQMYLSDVMGTKGNEVSLAMYDVKLFREKHYFPLKSAHQYMAKAKEQAQGDVKIKNSGFSKETKPHAKNPIVLSSFMDVWTNHVNEMSMYHAFVLPMEDFYRIYNYTTPSKNENLPTEGVNAYIENAYGTGATGYIEQMLKDLNGGARTDSRTGFINKAMGLFKKGAVFASLSVVVQQPSAIARAAALVDTKYFIGPKVDHKRHKALWDEVKQYAPVAVIKEMGYFDTNMGKTTQDFIMAQEYSGFSEKMKALVTDSDYLDEVLSKAPALADEIAWCGIWEAVKRETQAKHTGMDTKSEAFLKLVGERFTEVIVKTQVYDSVLARSGLMRSKDTGMKMATAFMAEPTTSINMVADALLQGKRGYRKYARNAIGSVIASQIINSILVSFVYAGRDDDEDETYWEKYIGTLSGEIFDSLNPAGYIPFIKDIVSIVQGYDVERSDMAVISDLWNAIQNLKKDSVSTYRKVEGFAGSIAQIFGLPLKNIMRDVRGIYQTVMSFVNGQQTTAAGVGYAVKGAITGKTVSNQQQLYEAYLSGNQVQIDRVKGRYKDQDAINSAIRNALRENDPRIKAAAAAKVGGDLDEYLRLAKEIIAEKHFSQDDVVRAVNAEINALNKGETTTSTPKASGMFKVEDFAVAISQGDQAMANAIKVDIIQTAQKNGKTQEEAEKSFKSSAASACKDLFLAGEISESQAINALEDYCGKTEDEAMADVQYWAFKQDYPDVYADDQWFDTYYEKIADSGISVDVYMEYRNTVASITGEGKKERRLAVIDSLPITSAQKDALYYAEGWAESKLSEAPWH